MSFDWVSRHLGDCVVTVYETNITLNKKASIEFERAYGVMLGFNEEKKQFAIKPIFKDEYELGVIHDDLLYKISIGRSYSRISNKRFVSQLSEKFNLDFKNNASYKYDAYWNNEDKALIIDL